MMNSRKSEYGHWQQYEDRSTRRGDDDDGWKERRGHASEMSRDAYRMYGGEAHTSTERTRPNREYRDSPKRMYNEDLPREENQEHLWRKGELGVPHKRAASVKQFSPESKSSPEWSISGKKQRTFTEDVEDYLKYKQEPEDVMFRQSPDNFPSRRPPKDFKHGLSPQEDFKYRKMPKDSKQRQQREELTYRQHPEDFAYRRPSGYYKDQHFEERNNDHPRKRTRSPEFSARGHGNRRDRNDSPSPDYDRRRTRTRPSKNEYGGQFFEADRVTHQGSALAERIAQQKMASKGFQRFLDVLNRGMDVSTLTKLVNPAVADKLLQSAASPQRSADRLWSPSCTRPRERRDVGSSHFSSNSRSRSRSPPAVEKIKVRPEDEHKRRQMQDVLQAIGMDFGFEELGQMSDRIQERLYGKKDSDRGHSHKEMRESETKRVFTPVRHSRSSSSDRSSFGLQFTQKRDAYKAVERVHTNDKVRNSSSQDSGKSGHAFQERLFPTDTVSKAPPTPLMPTYSAAQYSAAQYSATQYAAAQYSAAQYAAAQYTPYTYPPAPPVPPPNWVLPVGPVPPMPRFPGYVPYPNVPTFNAYPPPASAQSNTFLQPPNSQLTYVKIQDTNPVQALITSQYKLVPTRPRFLQVIDTEKPLPGKMVAQSKRKRAYNIEALKKYHLAQKNKELSRNFKPVQLSETAEKQMLDGDTTLLAAAESEDIDPEKKERKAIKLRLLEHKLADEEAPEGV